MTLKEMADESLKSAEARIEEQRLVGIFGEIVDAALTRLGVGHLPIEMRHVLIKYLILNPPPFPDQT